MVKPLTKKIPLFFLWISVFVWSPFAVFAQNQTFVHEVLTTKDGLSTNQVYGVTQDNSGLFWIVTEDGLNRYDGHEFKTFRTDPNDSTTLSSNRTLGIVLSEDNLLWIWTTGNVLNCFNPLTEKVKRYKLECEDSLISTGIRTISAEGKKRIWMGLNSGLACLERETGEINYWFPPRELDVPKSWDIVRRIRPRILDPENPNLLWVGCYRGAFLINTETKDFLLPPEHIFDALNGISVEGFYFEKNHLWININNYNALGRIDWTTGEKKLFQFTNDRNLRGSIRVIQPIDNQTFMLASTGLGLGIFDKKTETGYFRPSKDAPEKGIIKSTSWRIFQDRNSAVWVSTNEGLHIFRKPNLPVQHFILDIEESRSKNLQNIYSEGIVEWEKDSIYLAVTSKTGELFWVDKDGNTIRKQQLRTSENEIPRVWDLTEGDTRFWMVTSDGIKFIPKGTTDVIDFNHPKIDKKWGVRRVKYFSEKKMVAVSANPTRLIEILLDNEEVNVYNLEKLSSIRGIIDFDRDNRNNYWVGTSSGLIRFNPKVNQPDLFSTSSDSPTPLASSYIRAVEADNQGIVWVGHSAMGLEAIHYSEDRGYYSKRYRTWDGLSSDQIIEIEVDESENLWISQAIGMTFFDRKTKTFKVYKEEDGLLNNNLDKFNLHSLKLLPSGKIALGEFGYFTILDPNIKIEKEEISKAPIVFTGISLFEQPLKARGELLKSEGLKLNHQENYFTLHFTAPDLIGHGKHFYRYQLKGYDDEWHFCQNGKAPYTSVPPGNFTFLVHGSKNGADWLGEPTEIPIKIIPAFWQTTWFKALIVLSILSFLIALGLYRLRQIKKQESLKSEFEKKILEVEMSALRAQMNPHFIFNSLNSIKNFIVQNEPRLASRYLTKFSQLMRLILNNSENPTVRLEDELKALDLYMQLESMRFDNKFEYKIGIDKEVNAEFIEIPPLILQPYVENAIWHGLMNKNSKGHLDIRVERQNGNLQIEIEDDGIGREKAMEIKKRSPLKRKSMGMQITSERLELINNENKGKAFVTIQDLKDDNENALGTRVKITIPI